MPTDDEGSGSHEVRLFDADPGDAADTDTDTDNTGTGTGTGTGIDADVGVGARADRGEPSDAALNRQPAAGAGTLSVRDAVATAKAGTATPAPRKRSRRQRELWGARAVVALAAVAGLLIEVSPSGTGWADRLMAAGFVALLAAAGSAAKRWTWFIAAGAALALSDGRVALACGLVALVLTLLSMGSVRPVPAVGAAVGGLSGLALLRATDLGPRGVSALVVAMAVAPLLVSGYRFAGNRTRRRVRRTVLVSAILLVVICAMFALAAVRARPAAERGLDLLQEGMDAAREGDDALATQRLGEAADAFATADRHVGSWYAAPAHVVPVVGHNARAAATMASAAADVSADGTDAAYDADLQSLTVQGGTLDLERVRGLSGPLEDVATVLAAADADLTSLDETWLVGTVADQLDRVRGEVAAARPDVDLAAEATQVIPAMFGGDGESRWLVAFVTPVEARGRTGLVGNFAELTAVDGAVDMTRFGRSSELESEGTPGADRVLSGPEDYLDRWERFAPAETWRNVTMSPHFPSVGQVMVELYPQSGGQPVDGVIAIDPVGLAALMNFTGPIEVPGVAQPLDAGTAAEYLLSEQYVTLVDNDERLDTLETLARATFDQLTAGDLPSPQGVADTLGPAVAGGHIHAYSAQADQQDLFEVVGIDGALPEVTGDSLSVVVNNAVGNKIDLFLERDIDYDVTWDPATGQVAATATVTLTNNAPAAGLPDYVIGSPLPADVRPPRGTNRTYLSVYTPWALDGARLDDGHASVERQSERGRYTYSLYLDIPPGGASRTLTLDLRGWLAPDGGYSLDVTTQPMVNPDVLALAVEVAGDGHIDAGAPLSVDGRTAGVEEELIEQARRYRVEIGP